MIPGTADGTALRTSSTSNAVILWAQTAVKSRAHSCHQQFRTTHCCVRVPNMCRSLASYVYIPRTLPLLLCHTAIPGLLNSSRGERVLSVHRVPRPPKPSCTWFALRLERHEAIFGPAAPPGGTSLLRICDERGGEPPVHNATRAKGGNETSGGIRADDGGQGGHHGLE